MRNDILVEIIRALGGTVSDPGDRNALLADWLAAVSA